MRIRLSLTLNIERAAKVDQLMQEEPNDQRSVYSTAEGAEPHAPIGFMPQFNPSIEQDDEDGGDRS